MKIGEITNGFMHEMLENGLFYNDYIQHFNKNHDPKNGQFTSGPGGPKINKTNTNDINKEIDDIEVKREKYEYPGYDIGWTTATLYVPSIKKKNGNPIEFFGFGEDVSDKTLKESAKDYKKNEKKILKLAKEAILEDQYIYESWGKPLGMSKQDFIKKLEVKSVFCSDGMIAEISMGDKNEKSPYDLLGGHSMDIEFDLKNPKKPKWVAMNG